MGFLGGLRGKRQPPPPSWSDALLAMAHVSGTLRDRFQTYPTGRTGLIVRPEAPDSTDREIVGLEAALHADDAVRQVRQRVETDKHGHLWVMVRGDVLEELAEGIRLVSAALMGSGYEQRLLAAVFPFSWKEKRLYWIYNWSVGAFTPFVPTGRDELRDYPLEMRMESSMRKHVPTAHDGSQWFPIWDAPL